MVGSVSPVVLALQTADQGDGRDRIEAATWEHGAEEQTDLRRGEHGFFSITAKAAL